MIWDLIKASIGAVIVLAFLSTIAFASELCPPKKYACWMVQAAANKWGFEAVAGRARSCGWSESQISVARRCLR